MRICSKDTARFKLQVSLKPAGEGGTAEDSFKWGFLRPNCCKGVRSDKTCIQMY